MISDACTVAVSRYHLSTVMMKSITSTFGPFLTDRYREVAALQR